jgi:hypothetical protein
MAKWFVVTIIAPELNTGKALADYISSRYSARQMSAVDEVAAGRVEWSATHSLYADMGGFEVHFQCSTDVSLQRASGSGVKETSDAVPCSTASARANLRRLAQSDNYGLANFARRNIQPTWDGCAVRWSVDQVNQDLVWKAIALFNPTALKLDTLAGLWYHSLLPLQGNKWILDANQLRVARECGIIKALPEIAEDDINDRSKNSGIVKFLAVLQVLWLIAQLSGRKAGNLSSSQLEIATLAYAACSAITYLALLNKPQGAEAPYVMHAARYPTAKDMVSIAAEGPWPYWFQQRDHWMPNNAFHYSGEPWRYFWGFLIGSGLGATAFGAIHLFAWNFAFPTHAEQLLWRISAGITLALPWFTLFATCASVLLEKSVNERFGGGWFDWIWWALLKVVVSCYVLARMFILVEMCRTLYYLPPDTYITTWTTNVPHLS